MENMVQGVQICAGVAALLHLPLFINQKSRVIIFSCILFSLAFIFLEVTAVTYTKTSPQILSKLYHGQQNTQLYKCKEEHLNNVIELKQACCFAWKTFRNPAIKGMFPDQWTPVKCCHLLHHTSSLGKCPDDSEIKLSFICLSSLQYRIRYGTAQKVILSVVIGLSVQGLLTFEAFYFAILALYRRSKWDSLQNRAGFQFL